MMVVHCTLHRVVKINRWIAKPQPHCVPKLRPIDATQIRIRYASHQLPKDNEEPNKIERSVSHPKKPMLAKVRRIKNAEAESVMNEQPVHSFKVCVRHVSIARC